MNEAKPISAPSDDDILKLYRAVLGGIDRADTPKDEYGRKITAYRVGSNIIRIDVKLS